MEDSEKEKMKLFWEVLNEQKDYYEFVEKNGEKTILNLKKKILKNQNYANEEHEEEKKRYIRRVISLVERRLEGERE